MGAAGSVVMQAGLLEEVAITAAALISSIWRKRTLKCVSGGQINKDSEIVEWVAKLNALKEKEAQLKGDMTAKDVKKDEKSKKGDVKEIAKLKDEMDAYKLKLKEEFGYSKQDINKDPDLVEMQQRYKEMGGK